MSLRRFKTDQRWWFWISLFLFVIPWFLPIWATKDDYSAPGVCWLVLFTDLRLFQEALSFILAFSLLFAIPAISVGWVLHCVAVMVRDARRQRTERAE